MLSLPAEGGLVFHLAVDRMALGEDKIHDYMGFSSLAPGMDDVIHGNMGQIKMHFPRGIPLVLPTLPTGTYDKDR